VSRGLNRRKLSDAQVAEILRLLKESHLDYCALGAQFGVSPETIGDINRGVSRSGILALEFPRPVRVGRVFPT